jgi:hypothetical protein
MLLIKWRFANILANMNMNSSYQKSLDFRIRLWYFLVGWCEWYPDAAGAEFTKAGL